MSELIAFALPNFLTASSSVALPFGVFTTGTAVVLVFTGGAFLDSPMSAPPRGVSQASKNSSFGSFRVAFVALFKIFG